MEEQQGGEEICGGIMISLATFRQLALSFPDAEEQPHFDKASFRVNNKIFATLWEKEHGAMLKLPLIEQSVFCAYDKDVFFPVPGVWGKKGATFVDLRKVKKGMVKDALGVAYKGVVGKK